MGKAGKKRANKRKHKVERRTEWRKEEKNEGGGKRKEVKKCEEGNNSISRGKKQRGGEEKLMARGRERKDLWQWNDNREEKINTERDKDIRK